MMSDSVSLEKVILFVERGSGGTNKFVIRVSDSDTMEEPAFWGILLSDLTDHAARMLFDTTGRNTNTVRKRIVEAFELENKLKLAAPTRGSISGKTDFGKTN